MQLDMNRQESIWLERMLNTRRMATSYKAYWMMGVIEEIIEGNDVISFDSIVCRMITNAWYPIIKYKLNFGYQDQLGKVISYLKNTYDYPNMIKRMKLYNLLYSSYELSNDTIFQNMKKSFYNMVPYRLISPFFKEETRGLKDQKRNRLLAQLSQTSEECFYRIDATNKCIIINQHWMEYIILNQALIRGWLQNKLIIYIQNKNPSVPSILFKIDPNYERKLNPAINYWKRFNMVQPIVDIYTGKTLIQDNYQELGTFSIDHFIPWSFVLHDELWNLLPTFKNINSTKSDKLPSLNKYLDEFSSLQYKSITYMKQSTTNQRLLEDYLTIGNSNHTAFIMEIGATIDQEIFKESIKGSNKPGSNILKCPTSNK